MAPRALSVLLAAAVAAAVDARRDLAVVRGGARAATGAALRATPFEEAFKDTPALRTFLQALASINGTAKGECTLEGPMAGFGCAYPTAQAPSCKCPHQGEGIFLCGQPKMSDVDQFVAEGKMDSALMTWKAATAGRCTFVPWVIAAQKSLGAVNEEESNVWLDESDPFDGPMRNNPAVVKFREALPTVKSNASDGKCILSGDMGGYGCAVIQQDQPACTCPYGPLLVCLHPSRRDIQDYLRLGQFDKAFEVWKTATAGRCEVAQWAWFTTGSVLVALATCCICCLCMTGGKDDS